MSDTFTPPGEGWQPGPGGNDDEQVEFIGADQHGSWRTQYWHRPRRSPLPREEHTAVLVRWKPDSRNASEDFEERTFVLVGNRWCGQPDTFSAADLADEITSFEVLSSPSSIANQVVDFITLRQDNSATTSAQDLADARLIFSPTTGTKEAGR